jgi:hypothetical protein
MTTENQNTGAQDAKGPTRDAAIIARHTKKLAHRQRIGRRFRGKGEKLGLSLTILCLIPPPGESVPAELTARADISLWREDERPLREKYLRVFRPRYPTNHQAKKIKTKIEKHHPGACNFRRRYFLAMYGQARNPGSPKIG